MKYRDALGARTKMILYLDENLRVEAGKLIDGIRFLDLCHVINLAVSEWVEKEKRIKAKREKKEVSE